MTDEPNWPGQPPNAGDGDQPPTMGAHSTPGAGARRGEMRVQKPGSTTPRQPPLSEQRAREKAQQAEAERARAEQAAIEHKALVRRRVMLGAKVTVGLAAVVGIGYLVLRPDNVTAYCTGNNDSVADDQYCDDSYVSSHGGYSSGGFYYIPIPGGGYNQYRYYYGGTVSGGRVSGGSYTKPAGENISTRSGKTVQRGGFGLHGGRSSGS